MKPINWQDQTNGRKVTGLAIVVLAVVLNCFYHVRDFLLSEMIVSFHWQCYHSFVEPLTR